MAAERSGTDACTKKDSPARGAANRQAHIQKAPLGARSDSTSGAGHWAGAGMNRGMRHLMPRLKRSRPDRLIVGRKKSYCVSPGLAAGRQRLLPALVQIRLGENTPRISNQRHRQGSLESGLQGMAH